MQYFSTNGQSDPTGFAEAVLRGQPEDRGLFFPAAVPAVDWERLRRKTREEIAFEVIRPYVGGALPDETLRAVCAETVAFDFPLVRLGERIWTLELFHGPTLAFKDVGARFMSRCLRHLTDPDGPRTLIVVATSGDTGGAVAEGFHGVEGTEVVILYPRGKVSKLQELQLTTPGGNVTAVAVGGSFDDCQRLAKTALADDDLKRRFFVTSANSINIARWLPQQFYYFYALQQWPEEEPPVVSVPSGNFGNICAGLLARASGLPLGRMLAATNVNDTVPRFMEDGRFEPRPTVPTLSNAMDVADPSNFVRILELFEDGQEALGEAMTAVSVDDPTTRATIREVYGNGGYVLDPHGAVGYRALADHLERNPSDRGFFLETAHPIKFEVAEIIGREVPVPDPVLALLKKEGSAVALEADYGELRELLHGI